MYVHLDNYLPAPAGGAALHARQQMAVSRCRLLHAAATVGVAPKAVMSRAAHELRWRLALTESAVKLHGTRWMISPSYHAQETTEKTFTSFYMGMVMATLIGEDVYLASFLTHLKTALELLGMPPNTGKRPDFIAYRAGRGNYVSGTWEAKGTEGKLALSTLVTGKQQAMQPIGISGARGNIRVGSSSSFEKGEWEEAISTQKTSNSQRSTFLLGSRQPFTTRP